MDDFLNSFLLFGVPLVLIVPIIVNFFKTSGLNPKYAGFVAIAISVVLALLIEAMNEWPVITPWVKAVIGGILIGLAAVGNYSLHKASQAEAASQAEPVVLTEYPPVRSVSGENVAVTPWHLPEVEAVHPAVAEPVAEAPPISSGGATADPNAPGL